MYPMYVLYDGALFVVCSWKTHEETYVHTYRHLEGLIVQGAMKAMYVHVHTYLDSGHIYTYVCTSRQLISWRAVITHVNMYICMIPVSVQSMYHTFVTKLLHRA